MRYTYLMGNPLVAKRALGALDKVESGAAPSQTQTRVVPFTLMKPVARSRTTDARGLIVFSSFGFAFCNFFLVITGSCIVGLILLTRTHFN